MFPVLHTPSGGETPSGIPGPPRSSTSVSHPRGTGRLAGHRLPVSTSTQDTGAQVSTGSHPSDEQLFSQVSVPPGALVHGREELSEHGRTLGRGPAPPQAFVYAGDSELPHYGKQTFPGSIAQDFAAGPEAECSRAGACPKSSIDHNYVVGANLDDRLQHRSLNDKSLNYGGKCSTAQVRNPGEHKEPEQSSQGRPSHSQQARDTDENEVESEHHGRSGSRGLGPNQSQVSSEPYGLRQGIRAWPVTSRLADGRTTFSLPDTGEINGIAGVPKVSGMPRDIEFPKHSRVSHDSVGYCGEAADKPDPAGGIAGGTAGAIARGTADATFRGRIISGPIGPVFHNGSIMSGTAASVTSYETAYSVTPSISRGHDENIPFTKPPPLANSRIGKSRTFNVLSNLTSSISQSLSRSSINSRNASGSSSNTISAVLTEEVSKKSGSSLPRPSRKSTDNNITSQASNSVLLITEAKSTTYWSGRFVALNDRFLNELLMPRNLETVLGAHAALVLTQKTNSATPTSAKQPASHLRPSNTPGAVMQTVAKPTATADVTLLLDEDNRHRRIFVHLEAMCVGNEARKSLHSFQQDYARKMKRECLLPRGGTMEDRTLVSRIFGARRTSGATVLGSAGKSGKAGLDGKGAKSGKRLSIM